MIDRGPPSVAIWRRAERERLIAARLALPVQERRRLGQAISRQLEITLGEVAGLVISAYWPFRGEPDLRELMSYLINRGSRIVLPVVVERGRPLTFREWMPGAPLERGIWNIPVPAEGAKELRPDIVLAPVVGFDDACYRLGYGGGYYDRTLASIANHPKTLGVGYEMSALPTIMPQPHDIAMQVVVTEARIATRTGHCP